MDDSENLKARALVGANERLDSPRKSPIEEAVTQQQIELNKLGELVQMLNGKLSPVLTPIPNAEDRGDTDARPATSALHNMITDCTSQTRIIARNVQDLLERVEL